MSKFKVGDVVKVEFVKFSLTCIVIELTDELKDINNDILFYKVKSLESNETISKGQILRACEEDMIMLMSDSELKEINDKEVITPTRFSKDDICNSLEIKQNNDFIYFKDSNILVSKDCLKNKPLTISKDHYNKKYGVFLLNGTSLYQSDNIEDCQEFLSKLAEKLGSDIL